VGDDNNDEAALVLMPGAATDVKMILVGRAPGGSGIVYWGRRRAPEGRGGAQKGSSAARNRVA
jgi:hypothetical protein